MRTELMTPDQSTPRHRQGTTEWLESRGTQIPREDVPPVAIGPKLTGCTRDELLVQHLSTVRQIARRIHGRLPQHVELEELVSAGLLGLVDAANKFDGERQVQFNLYAQFRIRGAILDSLRNGDWSPRELRRKGRDMAEAIRILSAQLGRTPNDEEVAEQMGLNLREYQVVTGELRGLEVGSLNLERTEEVGDEELVYVAAPASENPLLRCMEGQTREQLTAAIETLPERERLVLTLYYFEELTLREIGLTLGVVESRVSQIRANAVGRLRAALQGKNPGKRSGRPGLVH